MNQKQIAAFQLQYRLGILIKREREVLNEILDLIIEADASRAYLELGYSSLFTWLTVHFQYCESSAKRRIDAARLRKGLPELREKIDSGVLNVTTMSKVQSAIRAEEKRTNSKMTVEQKSSVVEKIEGRTGQETERILMTEFPEAQIFQREKARVVSATEMSLLIRISHEEFAIFQRAQELLSHKIPCGSSGKIVAAALSEYVARHDPMREKPAQVVKKKVVDEKNTEEKSVKENGHHERSVKNKGVEMSDTNKQSVPAKDERLKSLNSDIPSSTVRETAVQKSQNQIDRNQNEFAELQKSRSRFIPKAVRQEVFRRDAHTCKYQNSQTGKICGSRYQIEIDHIMPWAMGGSSAIENLRCLCDQHNRHRAEETFGSRRRV